MVEHVHVELALLGKSGEREVAAADESDGRVVRVASMEQIELCV